MTDEKNKLLVDLEIRIKQVMFLCDSLKEENERLKTELQSKQTLIDETTKDLEQLKVRYNALKPREPLRRQRSMWTPRK